MLLFLDVISPIPEFFIIEDKKVIVKRKIIENSSNKLSDNIFPIYMKLNSDLNLRENLKKIVITSGPGSYTSLRVGAAFVSGLKISKNLLFHSISVSDIFKFKSKTNNIKSLGIFISSSNNQKFFCFMNSSNEIVYTKIENEHFLLPDNLKTIFYNIKEINSNINDLKQYKFSFINELLKNYETLNFTKNAIIKPIYISNNKILN